MDPCGGRYSLVRVGFVTIGQSPRRDITEDLVKILPKDVEIVEAGALDDLSPSEIREKLSPKPGETLYVTRLRSGEEVRISKEKIVGLIQEKISMLDNRGVDIIAILCSGEFPEFVSRTPILYPDKILKGIVSGIKYRGNSAVLIPAKEQMEYARDKWSPYLEIPDIIPISPYTSKSEDFSRVGLELRRIGAGLIVMDCMGYTMEQKIAIRGSNPGARIITSRGALARALTELL